jgi:hypothetical protein
MKAAPEGVLMLAMKPESEALMVHYRAQTSAFIAIADALSIPCFSTCVRRELNAILALSGAVELIEAVTRIGDYSNEHEYSKLRKSVSLLLKADGIRLPKGKRTQPGILNFVADIAPILLYLGLPPASSERSKLVIALRIIAGHVGLSGDPRDELRRLNKIEKAQAKKVREAIYASVAKGLSSLQNITPT